MFDFEMQSASHHLSSTLNVLNADEDVISKQEHDDELNFDDIVESILSLQESTSSSMMLISSISSIKSAQTALVSYISSSSVVESQSLMYVFEQQDRKKVIFLTQTSRFVFNKWRSVKKCTFMMLLLIENDRFCKHHADSCDKLFMITVLQLSFIFHFIT